MDKKINKGVKRKLLLFPLLALIVLALALGTTYAWWIMTKTQQDNNKLVAACLDFELLDEDVSEYNSLEGLKTYSKSGVDYVGGISVESAIPLTNNKGMDQNGYKFIVKNNCKDAVKYYMALENIEINNELAYIDSKYINIGINNTFSGNWESLPDIDVPSDDLTAKSAKIFKEDYIIGKGEKEYTLRLWMDHNTPVEEASTSGETKGWEGKVFLTGTVADPTSLEESNIAIATPDSCFTIENGVITDYDESCGDKVTIPARIDGQNVTEIASNAFKSVKVNKDILYGRATKSDGLISKNYLIYANDDMKEMLYNYIIYNISDGVRSYLKGEDLDNSPKIIGNYESEGYYSVREYADEDKPDIIAGLTLSGMKMYYSSKFHDNIDTILENLEDGLFTQYYYFYRNNIEDDFDIIMYTDLDTEKYYFKTNLSEKQIIDNYEEMFHTIDFEDLIIDGNKLDPAKCTIGTNPPDGSIPEYAFDEASVKYIFKLEEFEAGTSVDSLADEFVDGDFSSNFLVGEEYEFISIEEAESLDLTNFTQEYFTEIPVKADRVYYDSEVFDYNKNVAAVGFYSSAKNEMKLDMLDCYKDAYENGKITFIRTGNYSDLSSELTITTGDNNLSIFKANNSDKYYLVTEVSEQVLIGKYGEILNSFGLINGSTIDENKAIILSQFNTDIDESITCVYKSQEGYEFYTLELDLFPYDREYNKPKNIKQLSNILFSQLDVSSVNMYSAVYLEKIDDFAFTRMDSITLGDESLFIIGYDEDEDYYPIYDYTIGGLTNLVMPNSSTDLELGYGSFAGANLDELVFYNNALEKFVNIIELQKLLDEDQGGIGNSLAYMNGPFGYSKINHLILKDSNGSGFIGKDYVVYNGSKKSILENSNPDNIQDYLDRVGSAIGLLFEIFCENRGVFDIAEIKKVTIDNSIKTLGNIALVSFSSSELEYPEDLQIIDFGAKIEEIIK